MKSLILFNKSFGLFLLLGLYTLTANANNTTNTILENDTISQDQNATNSLNSYEFSKNFGKGWNLGNTLEAIGGETAWGNPEATRALFDALKVAGFSSVRLPVAWSKFTDETYYTIDKDWLDRVEEVVDYALNNDMYVIMNEHWDEGWLQPTYEHQEEANERLSKMWTQIAEHFKRYDDHLIFAGTNEVMVDGDYGTPTEEYYTVQNGFNQVFVDAVRATGGNNTTRYLAVQGFNTNINNTNNFFVMPQDEEEKKLLVEVHYYDPYNFTLGEQSDLYVWGEEAEGSESWANEPHADGQFKLMKDKFIDNGYGVIVGEYGALARLELTDDLNQLHAENRKYWTEYITSSIIKNGLVPFYWDNGYTSNHAFGLFDRHTGNQAYPELIEAIVNPRYVSISKEETADTEAIKIFPNPAKDIISVELNSQSIYAAKVYDSIGQVVKTLEIKEGITTIDIRTFSNGVYFIEVPTKEGMLKKKFTKQ